jgi:hypothetical protein
MNDADEKPIGEVLHAMLIAVFLLVLLAAAVTAVYAITPATRSGFLCDYSQLKSEDKRDRILIQRSVDFNPDAFQTFFVEKPMMDNLSLNAAQSVKLQMEFTNALAAEFGKVLRPSHQVQAHTLVIRTAITGARCSNVPFNVLTTIFGAPLSSGGVSAEAEILDGATGQRITALSWSRRGNIIWDFTQHYSSLGQARKGLRSFAERLSRLLYPGLKN